MEKVKVTQVQSATLKYLIIGIVAALVMLAFEIVIPCILYWQKRDDILGIFIIMQMPALIALLFTTFIKDWKNREVFNLYFVRLQDANTAYIKENFFIVQIDNYGILFVEEKDYHNYHIWRILQGYDHLRQTELFVFDKEKKVI